MGCRPRCSRAKCRLGRCLRNLDQSSGLAGQWRAQERACHQALRLDTDHRGGVRTAEFGHSETIGLTSNHSRRLLGGASGATQSDQGSRMKRLTVLLAEDEALIAYDIEDRLSGAGFEVLGPYTSVADAEERVRCETPDVAVVDVRLRDDS